ncbi:winged helix-turn-helix transcriptional regulator [Brochothrix thermosphacta]|uniref:winged helix-turn-helix transcriptional regulator n=1 Tax=Brochothrix thermosphacta TaxID=2756 RepID=UPI00048A7A2B|nr:winged helix-turn-helix transcriptional regulator [Brochothrix thermosphacta]ODJ48797.1 MarR family transcriptional regulator [Brochothrix thermosphacta DSM 20171 = FSL F6-1036]
MKKTVSLLSNKWKVLIIRELLIETQRFNALQRTLGGITQKVLTSNLKEMEKSGLVNREVFPVTPPHVEYSLTSRGRSLEPILETMAVWGLAYMAEEELQLEES